MSKLLTGNVYVNSYSYCSYPAYFYLNHLDRLLQLYLSFLYLLIHFSLLDGF